MKNSAQIKQGYTASTQKSFVRRDTVFDLVAGIVNATIAVVMMSLYYAVLRAGEIFSINVTLAAVWRNFGIFSVIFAKRNPAKMARIGMCLSVFGLIFSALFSFQALLFMESIPWWQFLLKMLFSLV